MNSLLDNVVIDEPTKADAVPAGTPTKNNEPAKPNRKRKVKPYQQLKNVTKHNEERKAEKKAKREGDGQLNAVGRAKAKKAAAVKAMKASLNAKPKVVKSKKTSDKGKGKDTANAKGASTNGKSSATCSFCGKPLSRHESVQNGMGAVCAMKHKLLPAGTTLEDHYGDLTVYDEPGKDYVTFRQVLATAKEKGVSGYKLVIAMGGERMLRPPLDKDFQVVMYKGQRYLPKACLKKLKDLLK